MHSKASWKVDEALKVLAANASAADGVASWPAESWNAVRRAGVLRWCIPVSYGGDGLEGVELLEGYEKLARACLTTCFILSQRDAACRRLRDGESENLRRRLLPPLAAGEAFSTVGLSQLTTSRQHTGPTFTARTSADGFVLNGTIPWVTGAAHAQHVVIGAVLEDGKQILAVLPTNLPGVTVGPALDLMALEGSLTAEVRCEQVQLDREWLLAGPAERVMAASGRGGTGGLETSCLALGLSAAAIGYLEEEGKTRSELQTTAERLNSTRQNLRNEMHKLVETGCSAEAAAGLRARANTLALRATQAALTASKGTGFLRNHPAQRWARQAMFFLVWSCPRPAAEATLAYLAPADAFACL
ncbi:MAG TPA: acyl-CoA dehydrogenase family protein [Gemmataceae bacterium]|nr:acyl-CoA dehydrogenase family protein [Gemmataceae bacterium]